MTFRHRAGVRPYTSSKDFAESCVFVKQSIPPSFCPRIQLRGVNPLHLLSGSLLPKLQEYFAEFLNWSSLTRLRILSSPTCVGFRYESAQNSLRHFSCTSRRSNSRGHYASSDSCLGDNYRADLPTRYPYTVPLVQPLTSPLILPQS